MNKKFGKLLGSSEDLPPASLRYYVFLLAVVVAISTMAHSVVAPLLPVYARQLSATPAEVGLIVAVFGFTRFATQPFLGTYSDKWGHKKFIQGMLLLFFVSGIGYGASNSLFTLIIFRTIQAVAVGGLSVSVRAYIVEITTKENRGRINGLVSSMQNVGSLLGPALGGVIADILNIRAPFYLLSFSIIICFLFSLKLPTSTQPHTISITQPQSTDRITWSNPLKLLGIIHLLEFMGLGIWLAVWPIYADERLGWSSSMIGASFSVSAFTSLMTAPIWGKITDQYGRTISAIAGLILLILQPISVILFSQSPLLLWVMFALAGAGGTGYFNAYFTLVGDLSPARKAGQVQGVLGSASQLGNAAGSLIAPLLWQLTSMQVAFWGDSILLGVCVLLFAPLYLKEKEKTLLPVSEVTE